MNQCSIAYLKDVLSGKNKVGFWFTTNTGIQLQNIKPIIVPQYEELTADKIYPKVKGYIENLADYFPEYDSTYIHPRKYFWDIFSTLNQKFAEKFIDHSIKERNKQKVTQESRIEISADIMENQ